MANILKVLKTETRNAIVKEYFDCRPVKEILAEFKICNETLYRCVRMLGLKPRRVTIRKNTWSQRAEMKTLYDSGKNTHEIAKMYDVSVPSVCYILKQRKTNLRESAFKKHCSIDESAFDTLTESSAYWLGFLMADGYIADGRPPVISLHLATADRAQVEKFADFLKSEHKIQNRAASTRLEFRSQRIADKLAEYGMNFDGHREPCASLVNNRHFWRGLIDGDGTIGVWHAGTRSPKPVVGLVGNEFITQSFISFAQTIGPTNRHPYKIKTCVKPTFNVSFSGGLAYKIIRELYRDCSVFLERKRITADDIVSREYSDYLFAKRKLAAMKV